MSSISKSTESYHLGSTLGFWKVVTWQSPKINKRPVLLARVDKFWSVFEEISSFQIIVLVGSLTHDPSSRPKPDLSRSIFVSDKILLNFIEQYEPKIYILLFVYCCCFLLLLLILLLLPLYQNMSLRYFVEINLFIKISVLWF